MLLDELRELVVDRGPHLARHHRFQRRRRHHQVDVALADVAGVDDAAGWCRAASSRDSLANESTLRQVRPAFARHRRPRHRPHFPPGTARLPRWASASRTGRCAAWAARHSRPAAPASAPGARRAWSARRRGFRRRSPCARSRASRGPTRWSAVDRATRAWSPGCAAACAASPRARSARCRRCAPARGSPARAGPAASAPRKSPRAALRDCAGCRSTAPSAATRTPRA